MDPKALQTILGLFAGGSSSNSRNNENERASDGRMICRKYRQSQTCGFGTNCRFAHILPSGEIINSTSPGQPILPTVSAGAPSMVNVGGNGNGGVQNASMMINGLAVVSNKPQPTIEQNRSDQVRQEWGKMCLDADGYCVIGSISKKGVLMSIIGSIDVGALLIDKDEQGLHRWKVGALPESLSPKLQNFCSLVHADATKNGVIRGVQNQRDLILQLTNHLKSEGYVAVKMPNIPNDDVEVGDAANPGLNASIVASFGEIMRENTRQLTESLAVSQAQIATQLSQSQSSFSQDLTRNVAASLNTASTQMNNNLAASLSNVTQQVGNHVSASLESVKQHNRDLVASLTPSFSKTKKRRK